MPVGVEIGRVWPVRGTRKWIDASAKSCSSRGGLRRTRSFTKRRGRNLLRWFGADRSHIDEPNSRTSSFLPRASLSPSSRTEKMRSKILRESCTFGYLWISSSNPNSARRRSSSHGSPQLRSSGSFKFCTLCSSLSASWASRCAFVPFPYYQGHRVFGHRHQPTLHFHTWASTNSFLLETPLFRSFSAETLIQKFSTRELRPPHPFHPFFKPNCRITPKGA